MTGIEIGVWSYRRGVLDTGADISGYSIHATDGDIGKVDKGNNETGSSYLSSRRGRGSSARP